MAETTGRATQEAGPAAFAGGLRLSWLPPEPVRQALWQPDFRAGTEPAR